MKRTTLLAACLICGGFSAARAEAPDWATYSATFNATWSAVTHPQSFPPSPHFSGLIGATHDSTVSFWSEGTLATLGVKQMAEWGSRLQLGNEILDAIAAGSAGEVVSADGIPLSPGATGTTFDITPDHPLLTVATMIAPSPDWFVGVDAMNLLDGEQWVSELVVPLYPYDAGTDSGTGYTSGDWPTVPPVPVSAITGAPFAPGVPLGTLTLRLLAAAAAGPPAARLYLAAVPNPFNPSTTLRLELPANAGDVQLAVFDSRGRLVRRLAVAGLGQQEVRWDGRTTGGTPAPAGVYFARLQIDRAIAVQKLALVK